MKHFTKPTLLAWFFFIAGLGTTLALGTWQVQRLAWKEGLIARIEAAQKAAPLQELPTNTNALEFHFVKLDGTWLDAHEFQVAARYFRGQVGYHLFAPLKLNDGRIVMVNRGWVPAARKEASSRTNTLVGGKANITCMLRLGADRNYFTPANQPAKNMWFGRDVAAMAAYAKLENVIANVSCDLLGEQAPDALPIPATGEVALKNDHLSYIITWFGIAAGIVVIFLLAHRRKGTV